MIVKRTFNTKLEPVDAFGLSNELLRPRGFTLDKGNPPRSQQWRRGVEPGKKAKGILNAPQTIELEFNQGRVNVTATAGLTGRKAARSQRMLSAYAEALERLLSSGEAPQVVAAIPKRAESAIRRAAFTRSLSICSIIIALIGGGAVAATTLPGIPNPIKWISSMTGKEHADGKKKSKTAPVVVVRKAGAQQTSAVKPSEHP